MRIYRTFLVLVAPCFYYSGFVPLVRWLRRRGRRGQYVVILNYHRAAIGDLGAHLRYLRRHYRIARTAAVPSGHADERASSAA